MKHSVVQTALVAAGLLTALSASAPALELKVKSITEVSGDVFVRQVTVKRTPASTTTTSVIGLNVGPERVFTVGVGDIIEISAPREVFRNIHGSDITNSAISDPAKIEDEAEERFTAIGISVNDQAQTGDPTLYRFTIRENTQVAVKWQHDYALTIKSDFSATQSASIDAAGNPYAGPLESEASGNPVPAVQKHWVKRGETQIARVDGAVADFSRPGSDIRYVPKSYIAYGPPNSMTSPFQDEIRLPTGKGGRIVNVATVGAVTEFTTDANHGLVNGRTVRIADALPSLNGEHVITVTGPRKFTIPVSPNLAEPGFLVREVKSLGQITNLAASENLLGGFDIAAEKTVVREVVDFKDIVGATGRFSRNLPFPNGGGNEFVVLAMGTINVPTTGAWTFGTSSDDGVRVRVDGVDVINDDALHAMADRFGTVANLTAGEHSIELVFFEHGGAAAVELFAAPGTFSAFDSSFRLVGDTANGGLAVTASSSRGKWVDLGVDIRRAVPAGNDPPYREEFTLPIGQDPGRQQVSQFSMYGPAGITYVWQIQYGVRMNVDDPVRGDLPELFTGRGDGNRTPFDNGEGVFWFDPGESLTIASEKTERAGNRNALNGWMNGDSYYFSGTADLDVNGNFTSGGVGTAATGGPAPVWNGGFTEGGTEFLGMEIASLQRSARVLWRYGPGAIAVNVTIGEYVFEKDQSALANDFLAEPTTITLQEVTGLNPSVGSPDMTVWDPVAAKLYPLVPGRFKADWLNAAGQTVSVLVTVNYPVPAHYPHLAGAPPVALDPDPDDNFVFRELRYTEGGETAIDAESRFTAGEAGKSVLLFSEIQRTGRGQPREFLRVRVVDTRDPTAERSGRGTREAVIGQKITDPGLDLARLGTGYLLNREGDVRYNPFVYDPALLDTLTANAVYDMDALRSTQGRKVVVNPAALPGPVIPVNLHPGADPVSERIIVGWYDDPAENDGLLWPHASRTYLPRWPQRPLSAVTRFSETQPWQGNQDALPIALSGDLALVASRAGDSLKLIDVGDPTQPVVLSSMRDGAGGFDHLAAPSGVALEGNLAVVASPFEGLTFIDVSDPSVPVPLAVLPAVGLLANASAVAIAGDLVFATSSDGALTIIDAGFPAQPVILSEIEDGFDGFNSLAGAVAVAVEGDLAFIAAAADGALTIADVSNPSQPAFLGEAVDGQGAFGALAGASAVVVRGGVAFVVSSGDNALSAIDVSEPSLPVLITEITDGQGGFNRLDGVSAISVEEDLAYLSSPVESAVTVIDISNPSAPGKVREINAGGSEGIAKLATPGSLAAGGGVVFVTSFSEGALTAFAVRRDRVGRIVIASQFGSESVDSRALDQLVAPPINGFPAETTYNPSRLQQVVIYNQPDPESPGYNANEEHALLAPSLRFASVSPRPPAAYALRDGDLNTPETRADLRESSQSSTTYTSHPYVLVSFFDTADNEFKMNVYEIVAEVPELESTAPRDYRFARGFDASTPPSTLVGLPHVVMEAGEPVIPFYPLGVAIGASPCAETYGNNLKGQVTYWEDHKLTSWAISGGENAWFTSFFFYPLAPDFWWPDGTLTPPIKAVEQTDGSVIGGFDTARMAFVPRVGDCVAFLPSNVNSGGSTSSVSAHLPTEILYKSNWPLVAPVLKAGETLTFQGGEFKADNRTVQVVNDDGDLVRVNTPGLPGIVGFAAAEVVFDSRNPQQTSDGWKTEWTARVVQGLDVRQVELPIEMFPEDLQPATGRTSVKGGKYVFNELSASLQKRFRYDPITEKIEFSGFLNDKNIGEPTLTAAPPAVYVLEPNILTAKERDELKGLADGTWDTKIDALYHLTRNPGVGRTEDGAGRLATVDVNRVATGGGYGGQAIVNQYLVGLEGEIKRDGATGEALVETVGGVEVEQRDDSKAAPLVAFGPGLALVPNGGFLDPSMDLPDISWITVVENNHPSLGGSPVTPHIIKVDRRQRYRGSIKTILSDNVFDENINLQHTGEFGANAQDLVFDWWYRPDDGSLNVPPPDLIPAGQTNPWKLFPDPSGNRGLGRFNIQLKGNPNAPEALLADTFWFARYRHKNEVPEDDIDWDPYEFERITGGDQLETISVDDRINFTWAGAGNNDPFNDFDLDGVNDFRAQLVQGWIKRVLDAVNPYEARIREFEEESPSTVVSMLAQLGPGFEGPVALNPDKNVIENVGLIELYRTILERGKSLSIDLSRPVSTPAISNALQLASTRLADFYTLLGNEAYVDALDQTIGFGSNSVEYGSLAPAVHAFQNQMGSLLEEELALLRGVDDFFARPVYNRLFWNLTKGEGEAAYALNYNLSDVNMDGFIDEDDAMLMYPQGHGDAWGHYLNALRHTYELLANPNFNWVSRSEFYNLQDIVIKVDFLDERKFAQVAAAKAKAGKEIVDNTYRENYVEDPTAQWQGYTDGNEDRGWGVQGWARRAGQGAYFDWVTANALLPSQHPNEELEGIQKVDRTTNGDIAVISANLNAIQRTFDEANNGYNPLDIASGDTVPFDIDPESLDGAATQSGVTHFEQVYARAVEALKAANAVWDNANQTRNLLRKIGNSEAEFRNKTFQENLAYRNRLIKIFGRPYEGTIGPGNLYPAGYNGPDLALYMYVDVREINRETVPGPTPNFASFDTNGNLIQTVDPNDPEVKGDIYDAFVNGAGGTSIAEIMGDLRPQFSPTFAGEISGADQGQFAQYKAADGWFSVNYTDLVNPKVPLDSFTQLMPVTAAGYTFQAPPAWGDRLAVGELQILINKMIQQEAQIARAIAAWDALAGEIGREFRLVNSRIETGATIRQRNEILTRVRYITNNLIKGIEGLRAISKTIKDVLDFTVDAGSAAVPLNLPTGGLAVSPGDALSAVRAGFEVTYGTTKVTWRSADNLLALGKLIAEISLDVAENEVSLANDADERLQNKREWLKGLEDLVGDEPVLRVEVFRQIQALKELSDRYRAQVDEAVRLIDERAAFNKRVAAAVQRNRYQDMTFRVSRNHALQTYRDTFDVAARYAYLAGKAYEYETNLPANHPASVRPQLQSIVRARGLGHLSGGQPAIGKGGISEALATMKANFDNLKGQLGFNNPQEETGKMSLRTEWMRIFPKGAVQPDGAGAFPSPGAEADDVWREALRNAVVEDLWDVSEFRNYCRPFAPESDGSGVHDPQPGIVLRFSTDITAGNNFFGKPLSGGDHAYDPTNFATKIRSVGVWFSDYRTADLQNDLSDAPRIYLVPAGSDIMNYPTANDPGVVRMWNVVDQRIPVPLPVASADLDFVNYIPLIDGLNDRFGDPRRFSSFRAYHDSGGTVSEDELAFDSRLIGRSVWNTNWVLIIPGLTLNAEAEEGLDRFIDQVSDIKLIFQTYGHSGG